MENKFRLVGYEDYNVIVLSNIFFCDYASRSDFYYFNPKDMKGERLLMSALGEYDLIDLKCSVPSHDELLDEAKTLYVHPSCTLSRALISKKYKKCLNPWLADAVVIPIPTVDHFSWNRNVYVFYSKDTSTYYLITRDYWSNLDDKELVKDTIFGSLVPAKSMANITNIAPQLKYNVQDLLSSRFVEETGLREVHKKGKWFVDVLLGAIPKNKIVYEDSVVKSLDDKESDIDIDNLKNIKEMLSSPDDDTNAAGLKALAMLNYMQYPQSVKYVIDKTWYSWVHCSASYSTAVKYMLKALTGNGSVKWIKFYDKFISQKDWDLFSQIIKEDEYFNPQHYSFLYFDGDMKVTPRIKV